MNFWPTWMNDLITVLLWLLFCVWYFTLSLVTWLLTFPRVLEPLLLYILYSFTTLDMKVRHRSLCGATCFFLCFFFCSALHYSWEDTQSHHRIIEIESKNVEDSSGKQLLMCCLHYQCKHFWDNSDPKYSESCLTRHLYNPTPVQSDNYIIWHLYNLTPV